jgi:hypothetical protein
MKEGRRGSKDKICGRSSKGGERLKERNREKSRKKG